MRERSTLLLSRLLGGGYGGQLIVNDEHPDLGGGGFGASATPLGRAWHEAGHLVAFGAGLARGETAIAYVLRQHGMSRLWLNDHVSHYATDSAAEALAEVFAALHTPGYHVPEEDRRTMQAFWDDLADRYPRLREA